MKGTDDIRPADTRTLRLLYVAGDVVAAIVVWSVFLVYRLVVTDGEVLSYADALSRIYIFYTPLIGFPLLSVLVHYLTGFYLNPAGVSKVRELGKTLVSALVLSLLLFFFVVLNDVFITDYRRYYRLLALLVGLQFVVDYAVRRLLSAYKYRLKRHGRLAHRVVVIQGGGSADSLIEQINRLPEDYRLLGVAGIEDFDRLYREQAMHGVIVSMPDDYTDAQLFNILSPLLAYPIEIQFTPRNCEYMTGAARIHHPGMPPLVDISRVNMPDWQQCVKRAFDVAASAVALIVTSPLMLVGVAGTLIDSGRPVFFKQERIGYRGKAFNILKLRTMTTDAEGDGVPRLSAPDDPRITRFGRWMRRYRVDELPQFWNVIRGDMSLVGYRPERKFFVDQIMQRRPYYCLLYKTRPGITSWGPVKVGYTPTIEAMISRLYYDIVYTENMSLAEDCKIMFYTLKVIFKGAGQ